MKLREEYSLEGVMLKTTPNVTAVTRPEIINLLRSELQRRSGGEVSACKVAERDGVFCRGFARYSDAELWRRYDWIARSRPRINRAELEEIADRWQMARQEVEEIPLACDVQQKVHDTCRGWDDFSNEDLARYYFEMTGKELRVQ